MTRWRFVWSSPVMAWRRMTGEAVARLAARWRLAASLLEQGRLSARRAVSASSQSITAVWGAATANRDTSPGRPAGEPAFALQPRELTGAVQNPLHWCPPLHRQRGASSLRSRDDPELRSSGTTVSILQHKDGRVELVVAQVNIVPVTAADV